MIWHTNAQKEELGCYNILGLEYCGKENCQTQRSLLHLSFPFLLQLDLFAALQLDLWVKELRYVVLMLWITQVCLK